MEVLKKIKKKGVSGCILSVKCRIIRLYNNILFKKYMRLPIDKNSIVLESEGDCCDNAYAFFDYMKHNGYVGKYKITWVVNHPENFRDEENVKYVKKNIHVNISEKSIKALRTCKWYIYDHCNLMADYKKRDNQVVCNLWHGCGVKYTQFASSESNIDFCIDLGSAFTDVFSHIFGVKRDKVFEVGYPRNDYFFQPLNVAQLQVKKMFSTYNKVIMWMPTFRRSNSADLDEGYFISQTGLPILTTEEKLKEFDDLLHSLNILCVFKIHHLQASLEPFKKRYTNITVVNDDDIHKMGLQQYQYIMLTDSLITDYSSVATDYLLLDKPIVFTLDDFEEYKAARGFWCENVKDFLPGCHVYNKGELYDAIKNISEGIDTYKSTRENAVSFMHKFCDGNSCERIIKLIGINKF